MAWNPIPICPGLDAELAIRFDGTNWIDVTTYLRSFSTTISRSRALGVFPPGDASFELDNRDGRFTPLNGSSPYTGNVLPGRHIRYRERYNTVIYDVWYGIIEDWGDAYPQAKDGIATIKAYQPTKLLAQYKTAQLVDSNGDPAPVGVGELSGARVSRILTAASWPLGSTVATGYVPLQGLDWSSDALSSLEDAVRTEMGALWCEGSGSLTFEDRYALVANSRSTTSQATFGPSNVAYFDEPRMSSGLDLVINQMTTANEGQTATTVSNSSSITSLGRVFAGADTALIGSDRTWAAGNADGTVRLYGTPAQHSTSITLVPAGAPSTGWPQALGRRIRDRVTVNVPTPWGATLTCSCWVVGIRHQGSPSDGRTTTFELEPAANYGGLTLFTLGTSALDGSHILGW